MKIVLFTPYAVDVFGGFEKIVKIISDYLSSKGFEFYISKLVSKNEVLPAKEKWVEPYSTACDSILIYEFERKTFHKFSAWNGNFRIINDQNSYKLRNVDIAIIISPFFLKSISDYFERIQSKAKIVSWFHLPLSYTFSTLNFPNKFVKAFIFKLFRFYQKQLKYAHLHLSISSGIAREIKMFYPEANVKTVYNPVLNDDYRSSNAINRPEKTIFAYIGRLDNSQKNIYFLFKGLSKLEFEWKLKILGSGPDEDMLKSYAKSLGIEKSIEWLGFSKDPFAMLRDEGVSALLLTSKFEGLPTVLIEAVSYGIPVVSSNCLTGPDDIIINGINGFLYKPGSIKDFIEKVTNIVSGQYNFKDTEKIRKTVEKFRVTPVCEAIHQELLNLYHNIK